MPGGNVAEFISYRPVDVAALPHNYPRDKRTSAEIINFEIAGRTFRVERFSEAIKHDPNSPLAWLNRGTAHFKSENYRAAVADFTRAIELDYALAYISRALAHWFLHDQASGEEDLDRLIDRFGQSVDPVIRDHVFQANILLGAAAIGRARRALRDNDLDKALNQFRAAVHRSARWKPRVQRVIELDIGKFYGLRVKEGNPYAGYDLPKRVITESKLREYIKEQAALLTERVGQAKEPPFPVLSERAVEAVIAHGKKHQWDDRKEHGWPYHTNAFAFVHITYQRWVNRGLNREILAQADPSLSSHLYKKISVEGLPGWLDLPTGPEARMRSIADPTERTKLEGVREFLRDQKRRTRSRKSDPS